MVWRCAVWQSNAILLKREKKMADVLTEQHQSFKDHHKTFSSNSYSAQQ